MKICPICSKQYAEGGVCPDDGATLVAAEKPDPLIGQILKGMYRIESRLAEGGMSLVYVARQLSLDRLVVVKVLKAGMDDRDFVQLFFREARIASQLNHPNVMHVHDFGNTDEGMMFLVVEYLRGENLSDLVEHRQGLPLENVVWLMEQICNGLQAAHQLNIVHRDLKPGNILVARVSGDHSVAKLLDFGISKPLGEQDLKYTQLGMIMGTPGYLAPEQIEGSRNIDHRADIYALGAILYFCITGEKPFRGENPQAIMAKQRVSGPSPMVKERLLDARNMVFEPVIQKAMAIDPQDRYGDTQSLLKDIQIIGQKAIRQYSKEMEVPTDNPDSFQFVFYSELESGCDEDEVRQRLKASLHLDEQGVSKLFSHRRVVVKKNISLEKAKKFDAAFRAAGAMGQIEEMDTATRIDPAIHTDERSLSQPILVSATIAKEVAIKTQPSMPSPSFPGQYGMGQGASNGSLGGRNGFTESSMQTRVVEGAPGAATEVANGNSKGSRFRYKRWLATLGVVALAVLLTLALPQSRYAIFDTYAEMHGWQTPSGVSKNQIRLGMSAAFSGGARELGRSMQLGIDARFREINESGGIHGRQLELRALDDGYEPVAARANMAKLLEGEEPVFALIGNVGTPTAEAIVPIALENRTIVFGTFSGAEMLRKNPPERYIFNYRASYDQETEAIIQYFIEQGVAPEKIAVFYQDDGYGRSGMEGVEDALVDYKIVPQNIPRYTYQRNSVQIEGAAREMINNLDAIDALVVIGTYNASSRITKRLRDAGFNGLIANVSFVGAKALAEQFRELGLKYADGIIVTQVVPPVDSFATWVLRYREALQKYYPSESPDFVSLEGYIVASLFADSLDRAGRYFTTESLVDTLESLKDVDVGIGEKIYFDSTDHQASDRVWGTRLNASGEFEPFHLHNE
ncbi:serine/threonine protein kinase [Hahella sp. CCB-MM4]|uniref:ABC transporter substrate-binding protein n=1 Tax=Hahella sp. (strain CCB-MM4) TaxID=1926491 RepID=UPI000B9BF447|nr:ABC transporter substrate-binding protein [Hahella sp. CCB-MM4]OZG72261.1 serine/threonine protein kinase [Hahella sp. CCB-MM4]